MLSITDVLLMLALFAVLRYDVDVKLLERYKSHKLNKLIDSFDEEELSSEAPADDQVVDPYQRDYDEYDKRIERMRDELETFNHAPSNAEESPGVFNIPHQQVVVELDIEPSVEEENETGYQEYIR